MGENEGRVPYDSEANNGLLLSSIYIPEEILGELFCHMDPITLLNSQLVCTRWNTIIQTYVWRKKAELILRKSLQSLKDLPWFAYYHICRGTLFNKNLVKNCSGQDGSEKFWHVMKQGGDHWKVENPPVGMPHLPSKPIFMNSQSCFVTSYYTCTKYQHIDLIAEGFNAQLLDTFRPPIVISEWYGCRWDCPAIYELLVILENKDRSMIDRFQFADRITGDRQNTWYKITHQFSNYGPGLRTIKFIHGGRDCLFWAGHYGSKMAGASFIVKIPQTLPASIAQSSGATQSEKVLP